MNRPVLFLSVCLVVALRAGPVKIEPGEIDFGTQAQGLHLESVVKLTNTTKGDLQILNVTSDCSCTAGEPRERRLAPGQSTSMPVGFDTRTYQGPIVRRLVIHTSSGEVELNVKATIRQYAHWELAPFPATLPASTRRQEVTIAVKVTHDGPGDFALRSVATDQPWLEASLSPGGPARTTEVTLRKLSAAPVGSHLAQVVFRTDDPQQPQLALKVFVPVVSPARVSPHPIILPTTKVGATAIREVVVSDWDETSAPRARLASGRVESRGRQPNGDYVFVVFVPAAKAGMHTQPFELSVDEANVLLTVPVMQKVDP